MQKIDFSNYKFRCHQLPTLMTGKCGLTPALSKSEKSELLKLQEKIKTGKKLTDLQAQALPELERKSQLPDTLEIGDTVKSLLKQIYLENQYGFKDIVDSKEIAKGLNMEDHGISMVSKLENNILIKNEERKENDYIIGTPDIADEILGDVKGSYNLSTFYDVDEGVAVGRYYYQLLGYMELFGFSESYIYFYLVPDSDKNINDQLYKINWTYEEGSDRYLQLEKQIKNNNECILKIPEELRIKKYKFNYSPEKYNEMMNRIEICRDYLNNIKTI